MDLSRHLSPTAEAIYLAYEQRDRRKGSRLGASQLGKSCDRRLWYSFRHAATEKIHGRTLRLFETGNAEEPRLVNDLRAIGCEVTGEQHEATACGGHVVAKIDAAVLGLPEAPKTWHDVSFKTMSAKNFRKLEKHGLKTAFPEYYAQLVLEMHMHEFTRGAVLAKNKDTDELYLERVYPDPELALKLLAKAQKIIDSPDPPDGVDNYECQWCPYLAICKEGKLPERNCRTCLHSTPVDGGKWTCEKHEDMKLCADHRYIPKLVDGKQVDVIDDYEGVVYKMRDGTEWVDGTPF